ncbi:MAG: asparagine synthase (glutamine-hydrolyzing) [Burkholderiales bacterium]
MCGIAGLYDPRGLPPDAEMLARQMLASIRHRGPDEFGIYLDDEVVLGSARLSIVDLAGGQQPIANEDETLWIVFNGEIFNHVELRPELEARGHRFSTHSDTEVILHLFEEMGPACLGKFNGQFAFAIWNSVTAELFLARDRMGERPLYYARCGASLYFGSEVKAILNAAPLAAEIDRESLRQVFTFWSPLPGRSMFRGISQLPPAHYMVVGDGTIRIERYWQPSFDNAASSGRRMPSWKEDAAEELTAMLSDSIRIRLRADVAVGVYLSGGLDSSLIASMVRQQNSNRLNGFSVAFTDAGFDEREHQKLIADHLGIAHHTIEVSHQDIGEAFPDAIWHMEVPTLRTAPVPMYLLSSLVHANGFKVVLTGEGADEIFAGYDVFKEAKVRAYWAREPASSRRPRLLRRLHPEVFSNGQVGEAFLKAVFGHSLADVDAPDYSHAVRWRSTRRTFRFLNDEITTGHDTVAFDPLARVLPDNFARLGVVQRAQALEMTVFLAEYLLSSQGDRMAMAHSVEGRYPFLDFRLVEFANALPLPLKLGGLREKDILRRAARGFLPRQAMERRKQPYRAPIHRSFFPPRPLEFVRYLLDEASLRRTMFFKPDVVAQLLAKVQRGGSLGETDDMALAGVVSTQLLHERFVDGFRRADPASLNAGGRVVRRWRHQKAYP